jgi:dipeptidyl aminopeptidase/acylaminoacyl peptidase
MVNANGSGLVNLSNTPTYSETQPAWSPDGSRIAYVADEGGDLEIYILNANDPSVIRQVTENEADDWFPAWSPDNLQIAFYSTRDNQPAPELYVVNADGTLPTRLTQTGVFAPEDGLAAPAWAPNGSRIAFVSATSAAQPDQTELFSVRKDGTDRLQYTADGARALFPAWSPDGTRLAFASDRGGNSDIYLIEPDGTGLVNVTNSPALRDSHPAWAPSGAPVPPAASATPTPQGAAGTAPGAQDLLLIYDAAVPVFTLVNTAGARVNLLPLSFSGAGRTVPATIWQTEFLASPLDNFQAGACLMIWRFGLPEQPTPAECGTARQGWISDEAAVFWTQGTFQVLYNGTPLATCDSAAKTCVVDLP